MGVHLLGRVTYESFAGAWPSYEGDMADRMNAMSKVVVSNTLREAEWNNTTVLSGDAVAGVRALKAQDGGPILVAGSATLIHTLLDNDLVDELRLMVFPVTIGEGLRDLLRNDQEDAVVALQHPLVPVGSPCRYVSPRGRRALIAVASFGGLAAFTTFFTPRGALRRIEVDRKRVSAEEMQMSARIPTRGGSSNPGTVRLGE